MRVGEPGWLAYNAPVAQLDRGRRGDPPEQINAGKPYDVLRLRPEKPNYGMLLYRAIIGKNLAARSRIITKARARSSAG